MHTKPNFKFACKILIGLSDVMNIQLFWSEKKNLIRFWSKVQNNFLKNPKKTFFVFEFLEGTKFLC